MYICTHSATCMSVPTYIQGYTDEPLEKIIRHVEEGPVVSMDRWSLEISRNTDIPGFQYDQAMGSEDVSVCVCVCVCVCECE